MPRQPTPSRRAILAGTLAGIGAARYARALAAHFQSEILLLHSLTPLYSDIGGMEVTGSMAWLPRCHCGKPIFTSCRLRSLKGD